MPPIGYCTEHADELAQEVVNAWAANMQAGNADSLTDDFKALFDKACRYREARNATTRQAFAEAYKAFEETHGRL
jgi:hypothetical protein